MGRKKQSCVRYRREDDRILFLESKKRNYGKIRKETRAAWDKKLPEMSE